MKGFVYVKQVSDQNELKNLINQLSIEPSYYFVRLFHAVSGIRRQLPEDFFPGFAGQMFNYEQELRWKQQALGYELLLLSRQEAAPDLGFAPICYKEKPIDWEICDRNAYFYNTGETQFPKGFIYQGVDGKEIPPIAQRYFQDLPTATVHFVALTVNGNKADMNGRNFSVDG
ncbi:MAG: hypothetical protein F6K31_04915 [Symploca sp. SIO2G7]|nr:hypothetical protein [Symploca sp. SIO2G7]